MFVVGALFLCAAFQGSFATANTTQKIIAQFAVSELTELSINSELSVCHSLMHVYFITILITQGDIKWYSDGDDEVYFIITKFGPNLSNLDDIVITTVDTNTLLSIKIQARPTTVNSASAHTAANFFTLMVCLCITSAVGFTALFGSMSNDSKTFVIMTIVLSSGMLYCVSGQSTQLGVHIEIHVPRYNIMYAIN